MPDFVVPRTDTKVIGTPGFEYAFQINARAEPAHVSRTTRGGRVFQSLTGGEVNGPRLQGTVYPASGGQYSFVERDGVHELNARFMIRAADSGEWIYVEHRGYRRTDGYYRVQAQFDADRQGRYASLNGGTWLAIGEEKNEGREVVFTYFEVV